MDSVWAAGDLQGAEPGPKNFLPTLDSGQIHRTVPGYYLWDFWPIKNSGQRVARVDGLELWLALSARDTVDRDDRHHHARIRLLGFAGDAWSDLGPLFRGERSFANNEWTGSANLDEVTGGLQLFYTAVGELGDKSPSYRQRIIQTSAQLTKEADKFCFGSWTAHRECLVADGHWYAPADQIEGKPGFIRAFRDPCWFRDPETGGEHLVFTASSAHSTSRFSGIVGLARATDVSKNRWALLPPLFTANGVNNELERAHLVYCDKRYYLFWSTQELTFNPQCTGPNGLYGACSENLGGPYRMLNGSGLVFANPPESPEQCYAWQVLEDLTVVSHVHCVPGGEQGGVEFFGCAAPWFKIELEGDRARLSD